MHAHGVGDQRSCADKGAKCPVLIIGTVNGSRVRLSTARFLPPEKARDLEEARGLALEWERTGIIGRPREYAPIHAPTPERAGVSRGAEFSGLRFTPEQDFGMV